MLRLSDGDPVWHGAARSWRTATGALVLGLVVAATGFQVRPATAQEAVAPPPSSLELRLAEHDRRQAAARAAERASRVSRQQRLTGRGETANPEAFPELGDVASKLLSDVAVKAALAALVGAAGIAAFSDDASLLTGGVGVGSSTDEAAGTATSTTSTSSTTATATN